MFGATFPIHVIAAEHGTGMEELRDAIYQFLQRHPRLHQAARQTARHDVAVHLSRSAARWWRWPPWSTAISPRSSNRLASGAPAFTMAKRSAAIMCCTIRMWWSCIFSWLRRVVALARSVSEGDLAYAFGLVSPNEVLFLRKHVALKELQPGQVDRVRYPRERRNSSGGLPQ